MCQRGEEVPNRCKRQRGPKEDEDNNILSALTLFSWGRGTSASTRGEQHQRSIDFVNTKASSPLGTNLHSFSICLFECVT